MNRYCLKKWFPEKYDIKLFSLLKVFICTDIPMKPFLNLKCSLKG